MCRHFCTSLHLPWLSNVINEKGCLCTGWQSNKKWQLFSELMTKIALDEISPFRPKWEVQAFKKLYYKHVSAQVWSKENQQKPSYVLVELGVPSSHKRIFFSVMSKKKSAANNPWIMFNSVKCLWPIPTFKNMCHSLHYSFCHEKFTKGQIKQYLFFHPKLLFSTFTYSITSAHKNINLFIQTKRYRAVSEACRSDLALGHVMQVGVGA